jgi:hypothetical protein
MLAPPRPLHPLRHLSQTYTLFPYADAGILALPSLLDDSLGCRCFMGRGVTTSGPSKGHMDIPISVNDTPAAIAKQWALLREEFSSQSSGGPSLMPTLCHASLLHCVDRGMHRDSSGGGRGEGGGFWCMRVR